MKRRMNGRGMALLAGAVLCAANFAFSGETGDYLHYRLGMKYKAEKIYDKAIEEFRKVLAEYPDNYHVYMHIAEIRTIQANPRLAIANLKQALTYNPGWSKALLMLADSYVSDGQLQKAIVEYQHYQQVCDPAQRDSIQQMIDRFVEKIGVGGMLTGQETGISGETKRSGTAVRPSTGAPPENERAAELFKKAVALYHQQQYDTSLAQLRQVLVIEPGYPGAYYYAGIIRYLMGQRSKAKINLIKSKGYSASGCIGSLYRGKIYGEEKNYSAAVRELSYYSGCTDSAAGKKEAQVLIAAYKRLAAVPVKKVRQSLDTGPGLKRDTGEVQETKMLKVRIDSMLCMVSVDTLSDAGQKLLEGIKEFQTGNYDNAIREFKKTLASHPKGAAAVQCIYNTGVCYSKLRLWREAENQFQQIIERYGRHELAAQSLFLKALTYSERREISLAERAYRQFLKTYSHHPWRGKAWEKLGDIYAELEQPKKAIDAYTQAAASFSHCSDQVSGLFKTGDMYIAIGNMARAISCFDSAIVKGERCNVYVRVPDSYYRIADEKYKAKEYAGALEYYKRVVRKYPSFQETPWGLFQIGTIHKKERRYKEAIDVYKDLMKRFPEDYWAKQAQWKLDDTVWEHEYQATLR